MNPLDNPFDKFLTALTHTEEGLSFVRDASGDVEGSIETTDHSQILRDEFGIHAGRIDQITENHSTLRDEHGMKVGESHTIGDTTTVTDSAGNEQAHIHHGPLTDTIEHADDGSTTTVEHIGADDVYRDELSGLTHSVDHVG
jgi:hypothetical protein